MFSWISTSSISKHLQAPYPYAVFTHLKLVWFPALCRQATIIGMSLPWQNLMSSMLCPWHEPQPQVMHPALTQPLDNVLNCNGWTESTKSAKCLACSLASVLNNCSDFNTVSPPEECNFKMKAMGEMPGKEKKDQHCRLKMYQNAWKCILYADQAQMHKIIGRLQTCQSKSSTMWTWQNTNVEVCGYLLSDALNRLENLHWIQIESLRLVVSFTYLAHVSLKGLGTSAVHTCTSECCIRHCLRWNDMKRHQTSQSGIRPSKLEFAHPSSLYETGYSRSALINVITQMEPEI